MYGKPEYHTQFYPTYDDRPNGSFTGIVFQITAISYDCF